MAQNVTSIVCGICQQQDRIETTGFWCLQCDEGLCVACKESHQLWKLFRSHKVISIGHYKKKLPTDILAGKHTCAEHDLQVNLFCRKHEQPCCSGCLKDKHPDCVCQEIELFDNVVKNVKSSTKFESIEKSAAELKSDLESVITYCSETMTNIGNQMMACRKEIKQA